MADLTKIKLPDGNTYNIKDTVSGYTTNTGTVTSVTIKGTSPIVSSSSSAITTSGTRTISHADSGVTAGTYKSVTVNATGHVTAGSNPTTLSGYGITDAKIESGTITLGSNTITPLTSHQTVTDGNPTLDWGTQSTVATIGSTDIHVNLPANPNTDIKVRQALDTSNGNYPILLSAASSTNTTANIDNTSRRNNSIFANPSTGRITSKNLTVGISADNATFPNGAIKCYDVRNVTGVPTTEGANFIMTNEGSPISSYWYSGIYVKSSGGEYGAWELVGPALNADNRTKPLYVRSSNKTTAWGDWRKIYDSANPPTASDVGALASTTKYALSNSVGGDALNSAKVGGYTIGTTSVGSASTGSAITADDITSWTTNTPTAVTKKTVVTSATFNTVVTGGSKTSIPNISKKTVVTGVTKKTVVTSASGATASYANGILTLTDGAFGTGDSCTVTTGDSVTVGTAIEAYTSLTTGESGSCITGDSCTVTAGTAATLKYTARSIPNISVTSTTVATATSS